MVKNSLVRAGTHASILGIWTAEELHKIPAGELYELIDDVISVLPNRATHTVRRRSPTTTRTSRQTFVRGAPSSTANLALRSIAGRIPLTDRPIREYEQ